MNHPNFLNKIIRYCKRFGRGVFLFFSKIKFPFKKRRYPIKVSLFVFFFPRTITLESYFPPRKTPWVFILNFCYFCFIAFLIFLFFLFFFKNPFHQSIWFYLLTLVLPSIPPLYVFMDMELRNGFFITPFTVNFGLSIFCPNLESYLICILTWIGVVMLGHYIYQTQKPWNYFAIQLYRTHIFTWYGEVYTFRNITAWSLILLFWGIAYFYRNFFFPYLS